MQNWRIELVIQDTGSGIHPDHLQKIFEPFFTTKNHDKSQHADKTSGTGLGLHTCTHLMKSYNAHISVESLLDVGTTFQITLPKENIFL